MKQKIRMNLLGALDLILALGAICTGVLMIRSNYGVFSSYPEEWLSKLPFDSWVIPGIIAIVVFGLGNIIAAIFSFKKENNNSWSVSAIMGGVLFLSFIFLTIVLGEWFLATVEIMISSIIQLCLSVYVFSGCRKVLESNIT